MRRFRILEFSFVKNSELEEKLNNEISKSEKIIRLDITKDPHPFSLGAKVAIIILENYL